MLFRSTASELTADTKSLSAFPVTGCTSYTVAAFKPVRVAGLHFQMLRAGGMQFTAGNTDAAKPSLHPNGLDMGGSVGFDAPTGAPPPAAEWAPARRARRLPARDGQPVSWPA